MIWPFCAQEDRDPRAIRPGAASVVALVRRLLIANAALAALLAGHVIDHVARQPGDEQLGLAASLPGLLGTVAVFVSLVLVARNAKYAAQFAGLVGLATALGFVAVHLAPHWSIFSDPYEDRYLDAGSWIEMLAALACGLWVAAEGLRVCRATAAPPPAPARPAG
jgi:hypothetical protein